MLCNFYERLNHHERQQEREDTLAEEFDEALYDLVQEQKEAMNGKLSGWIEGMLQADIPHEKCTDAVAFVLATLSDPKVVTDAQALEAWQKCVNAATALRDYIAEDTVYSRKDDLFDERLHDNFWCWDGPEWETFKKKAGL